MEENFPRGGSHTNKKTLSVELKRKRESDDTDLFEVILSFSYILIN